MYKIIFFVPESHAELVKQAVFDSGAGRQGHYEHCCWQTLGQGEFMPLPGSQPYIGQANHKQIVAEYRVELLCDGLYLKSAIDALRKAHPYEEPAIDIIQLYTPE